MLCPLSHFFDRIYRIFKINLEQWFLILLEALNPASSMEPDLEQGLSNYFQGVLVIETWKSIDKIMDVSHFSVTS